MLSFFYFIKVRFLMNSTEIQLGLEDIKRRLKSLQSCKISPLSVRARFKVRYYVYESWDLPNFSVFRASPRDDELYGGNELYKRH